MVVLFLGWNELMVLLEPIHIIIMFIFIHFFLFSITIVLSLFQAVLTNPLLLILCLAIGTVFAIGNLSNMNLDALGPIGMFLRQVLHRFLACNDFSSGVVPRFLLTALSNAYVYKYIK